MIFGSISYLNLLPFQIFLKRYIKHSAIKMSFNYKRAVPSKINYALKKRQINAGFISSIESKAYKCSNLGIIANREVHSVFVIEGEEEIDKESATSNALASLLKIKGRVIIGDKALKYHLEAKKYREKIFKKTDKYNSIYHNSGDRYTDLATEWYKKTELPFVFARLCYNSHSKIIKDIEKKFLKQPIRIPQYILKKEAEKRVISPKDLRWYLKFIRYRLDYKSKRSLKLFLKKVK